MSLGIGEGQLAVPPGGPHPWPAWMDVSSSAPIDVGISRRVLVVRTDHLGDLVLSTPFLETVRRSLPRSSITALVTPYTKPVLERNPSVDEILTLDDRHADDRQEVLKTLKHRAFDVVIALSPTMRAYSIARLVKAPVRAGYIYSRRWVPRALSNVLLTHRAVYHIDTLVERKAAVPHEVEQLLWLARMLGLSAEPVPLRLYPDPDVATTALLALGDDKTLTAYLDSFHQPQWDTASRRDCPWLAVHLSPAWVRPPWKLESFLELIRGLLARIPDAHGVITYGPLESEPGHELERALRGVDRVRVAGGLQFSQWAGILGAARMALSGDTGAIHVAAAMRTPVVAAYEQATFHLCSQQWAPWMVSHRKVEKGTPAETIPRLLDAAEWLWKPGR